MDPLWTKLYESAVASGTPNPKIFADTACKYRNKVLELRAKRHKTVLLTEAPKISEGAPAPKKATKKVLAPEHRCKALTLEGRQCGFRAWHGGFCTKHKPVRDEQST
jgi:hypothetical protein